MSQSGPFRSRSGTLLNPLSGGYGSRPRPKTGPPRGSFSPSGGQQLRQISAKIIFLKNKWTGVEPKWSSSVAFGYPFEPRVWGLRLPGARMRPGRAHASKPKAKARAVFGGISQKCCQPRGYCSSGGSQLSLEPAHTHPKVSRMALPEESSSVCVCLCDCVVGERTIR